MRLGERSLGAKTPTPRQGSAKTRLIVIVAVALILVAVAAVAAPLFATSSADFFSRYHLLNRRYVNLEHSAHEGIGCRDCHETDALRNGVELTAEFYAGLVNRGELPTYFKFQPPRNEACLKCHATDWSSDAERTSLIPHPAHTRVADETRPCVKCHKWTAHLETYMAKHKKMPFSGVCVAYGCHVGTKQSDQCFDCHHVLRQTAVVWKQRHQEVVRTVGQNGCLEVCHKVDQCQTCHTTGRLPKIDQMTIRVGLEEIERLHVRDGWTQKNHGPLALKSRKDCLLCHQSQGECQECHRDRPAFHGQDVTVWIGTHNRTTKDLNDPRCLECHKKPFCDECHKKFKEME